MRRRSRSASPAVELGRARGPNEAGEAEAASLLCAEDTPVGGPSPGAHAHTNGHGKPPTQPAEPAAAKAGRVVAAVAYWFFSVAWTWVFHDWFCGQMLGCGCTWPWAGGSSDCNWHHTTALKCPWCLASPAASKWTQRSSTIVMFVVFAGLARKLHQASHGAPEAGLSWALAKVVALSLLSFFCTEFFWIVLYGRVFETGRGYPCFVFYKPGQCTTYTTVSVPVPGELGVGNQELHKGPGGGLRG